VAIPLTPRQAWHYVPEYRSIIACAGRGGWLAPLIEVHSLPCTRLEAMRVLDVLDLDGVARTWRSCRGRAYHTNKAGYRISLPTNPGARCGHLRVGLVLHEAAHIWDRKEVGTFSHGPTYCRQLRRSLSYPWRRALMKDQSLCEIYDRHDGPYTILLVVQDSKGEQRSARVDGMFPDGRTVHEAAREQARQLNVVEAFVYSEHEKQFIGIYYKNGTAYRSWEEERERMELSVERPASALLPAGAEPVQTLDDSGDDGLPAEPVSRARPVRDVPAQEPTAVRAPRAPRKVGVALTLDGGNAEAWPQSAAAQAIRTYLESHHPATCKDIVTTLGPRLNELGVQFPAALVSRLKQAGYVKEATA
jgi:hypothetical protein